MKNKLLTLVAICFGVIIFSGCATQHWGDARIENTQIVSQLEQNKSTKEDVYIQFGQPHDVFYENESNSGHGKSVWYYYNLTSENRGQTFIPFVGLFAGGTNFNGSRTKIFFDAEDKVEKTERKDIHSSINMWSSMNRFNTATDPILRVSNEMHKMSLPFDTNSANMFRGMELIINGKESSYSSND